MERLKTAEDEEEEKTTEVDLKRRENNLKKIYMFYCSQQPEKMNSIQYKKRVKAEDLLLHFDTFIMFTKHFGIMGQEKRKAKVSEKNTLEMKRLGVIDVYDDQEDQLMMSHAKKSS